MIVDKIEVLKEVAQKYNVESGSAKSFFLLLGATYDLSKEDLEKLMRFKEEQFSRMFMYLLALTLMSKSEQEALLDQWAKSDDGGKTEAEKLDELLRRHYQPKMWGKGYYRVRKELLESKTLKASQIEVVNKAVEMGLPEDEIMIMIRQGKEANVMMKYVEFFRKIGNENKKKIDKKFI